MKGNLDESKQLLDQAISIYRKDYDPAGLTLALTRRANTLRLLGNYNESMKDVDEALVLAESNTALQPHYAEGLRLKGLNLHRLGESRHAIESLEHSLSLYTALNEVGSIPTVLMETGMVHHAVGDVDSAKHSYQDALKFRQAERNLYYQAEILNNLAVLYHQIGEYELACETFENGLDCARKSRNQRAESLILTGLGDLYGEVEEFDAALQAYEQAELVAGELPGFFISNYLVMAKGFLTLLRGELKMANQILNANNKKIKMSQSAYERGLWNLFEGRFYLLKGEPKKAIRLLQECRDFFVQDGRDFELHWSTIWLIAAYEQAEQTDRAHVEIRDFFAVEKNPDYMTLVALRQAAPWLEGLQKDSQHGRQLSSLLEKCQRLTLRLPSIRRTLRRHAQSIQMPSASLEIRALGRAEVTVNGRTLAMSDWRTKSVRDLFFYFLFKQEALTKEQIGEALWPETSDPQILKARFKDEIYRLRRAAGRNVVVFDDIYYSFNRTLDYEYDVEAFESYLARARKTREISKRIEWYQKAVDLVHGPYLIEVDTPWSAEERERLGQIYVSALEQLAHLYLDTNQTEQCITVCQLALGQDRYNELIYRIGMRAYFASGDRVSIARQYQACKLALEEGLGLPPSQETDDLYRELTA